MKKLFLLLTGFIATEATIYGQADYDGPNNNKQAVTRTIESFGAIADDGVDDTYAFEKAARYFSNEDTLTGNLHTYIDYTTKYGVLAFGKGTYDVGQQQVWTNVNDGYRAWQKYDPLFQSLDGLIIQGKRNLISGKPETKIQLRAGSYFGYFKRTNQNNNGQYPVNNDTQKVGGIAAHPGTIFRLAWNARNVIIKDIELDGRSDTYIVGYPGAPYSDYGCFSYGINSGAQFLSLENLYAHNFGEDGIRVEAATAPAAASGRQWNITMNNVRSLWNGRQALSWCHGRDVKVENSTFAYTRLREGYADTTAVADSIKVHKAPGAPGCNIDIEPEYGYTDINNVYHPDLTVINGLFNNCKIIGNYGPTASLAVQLYSDSMQFKNCEIKGFINSDPNKGSGFAAIGMQSLVNRNVVFDNCTIRGTISFQRDNASWMANTGLTKFLNCNIATNNVAAYTNDYPLIFAYDKVLFDKCTIRRTTGRPLMDIRPKNGIGTYNNPDNYVEFRDCNFISDFNNPAGGYIYDQGNIWFVRYTGTTNASHTAGAPSVVYNSFMYGTTMNGSSMYSPMNTYQFANHHTYLPRWIGWMYDIDPNKLTYPYIFGETPCEFLKVNIGDGSSSSQAVFKNDKRPVYIGEGVSIIIKKDSKVELSGDIYLAGQIILEAGGTLKFDNARVFVYNSIVAQHITGSPSQSTYVPNFTEVAVTKRSDLMAPQQFLKSNINRSYYDSPNFKGCVKCYQTSDPNVKQCLDPNITFSKFSSIGAYTDQLNALANTDVVVYPNPTSNNVTVRFTGEGKTTITVIDINGKILQTLTSEGTEEEISLQQYPAGTYLLKVSNNSMSTVKKITRTN